MSIGENTMSRQERDKGLPPLPSILPLSPLGQQVSPSSTKNKGKGKEKSVNEDGYSPSLKTFYVPFGVEEPSTVPFSNYSPKPRSNFSSPLTTPTRSSGNNSPYFQTHTSSTTLTSHRGKSSTTISTVPPSPSISSMRERSSRQSKSLKSATPTVQRNDPSMDSFSSAPGMASSPAFGSPDEFGFTHPDDRNVGHHQQKSQHGSSSFPIGRKKSSGALLASNLGKGLSRMGSVMKKTSATEALSTSTNSYPTNKPQRKGSIMGLGSGGGKGSSNWTARKKWKPQTMVEEEEMGEGWERVDREISASTMSEMTGDENISRPFQVEHDLHVSPDLEDLPPAWLLALKTQGLTEQDLMLIASARRRQREAPSTPLRVPVEDQLKVQQPGQRLTNRHSRGTSTPVRHGHNPHGLALDPSALRRFSFEEGQIDNATRIIPNTGRSEPLPHHPDRSTPTTTPSPSTSSHQTSSPMTPRQMKTLSAQLKGFKDLAIEEGDDWAHELLKTALSLDGNPPVELASQKDEPDAATISAQKQGSDSDDLQKDESKATPQRTKSIKRIPVPKLPLITKEEIINRPDDRIEASSSSAKSIRDRRDETSQSPKSKHAPSSPPPPPPPPKHRQKPKAVVIAQKTGPSSVSLGGVQTQSPQTRHQSTPRKSSDSFGVHYSRSCLVESRSSVDLDLVTPSTVVVIGRRVDRERERENRRVAKTKNNSISQSDSSNTSQSNSSSRTGSGSGFGSVLDHARLDKEVDLQYRSDSEWRPPPPPRIIDQLGIGFESTDSGSDLDFVNAMISSPVGDAPQRLVGSLLEPLALTLKVSRESMIVPAADRVQVHGSLSEGQCGGVDEMSRNLFHGRSSSAGSAGEGISCDEVEVVPNELGNDERRPTISRPPSKPLYSFPSSATVSRQSPSTSQASSPLPPPPQGLPPLLSSDTTINDNARPATQAPSTTKNGPNQPSDQGDPDFQHSIPEPHPFLVSRDIRPSQPSPDSVHLVKVYGGPPNLTKALASEGDSTIDQSDTEIKGVEAELELESESEVRKNERSSLALSLLSVGTGTGDCTESESGHSLENISIQKAYRGHGHGHFHGHCHCHGHGHGNGHGHDQTQTQTQTLNHDINGISITMTPINRFVNGVQAGPDPIISSSPGSGRDNHGQMIVSDLIIGSDRREEDDHHDTLAVRDGPAADDDDDEDDDDEGTSEDQVEGALDALEEAARRFVTDRKVEVIE